jgi:hypothetical protein
MAFNFNIFQCFWNSQNHWSNFSYLVCISCKIFIRWRFYLFLKTENSRRVAESRPVCVGLNRCSTVIVEFNFLENVGCRMEGKSKAVSWICKKCFTDVHSSLRHAKSCNSLWFISIHLGCQGSCSFARLICELAWWVILFYLGGVGGVADTVSALLITADLSQLYCRRLKIGC